jgi:hypothetical protein
MHFHCHVPHGSGPCLPARGGLRCCHVSHEPERVTSLKNKEMLSCNGIQQGLCVFKTHPHVTEATARCAVRRRYHDLQTVQTDTIIPCYSAVPCG